MSILSTDHGIAAPPVGYLKVVIVDHTINGDPRREAPVGRELASFNVGLEWLEQSLEGSIAEALCSLGRVVTALCIDNCWGWCYTIIGPENVFYGCGGDPGARRSAGAPALHERIYAAAAVLESISAPARE